MQTILLVFPNQLFASHPGFQQQPDRVAFIEDSLFFGDWFYPMTMHKQKLWLHRSTMKRFAADLGASGHSVTYVEYSSKPNSLDAHLKKLQARKKTQFVAAEPCDFILEKRLRRICQELGAELSLTANPGFINSREDNREYRTGKKRWFMADFYKWQRKRMDLLMEDGEPRGGKWSFDEDNRKKVPKKMLTDIPEVTFPIPDEFDIEAKAYVENKFSGNFGSLSNLYYPTSHATAARWLKSFLKQRFEHFGDYEDAIVEGQSWLWHSVLTPMLNVGLLTPQQIIQETTRFERSNNVPLNSLEGFVRQVIGWREFMRATYEDLGVEMRTTNHWQHHRSIPSSFYDGTTGIVPIDDTIRRILETGYCHHIERLMVLGGFMFLCEFDPNEIYRWFMEMFIDSYDWVMVPNAYSMSQHADGGLITTKPYFSGSAYVRKMSHHKKGEWSEVWDGLYWRWIWNHVDQLEKNPRWAMMCSMAKRMDKDKLESHLDQAESFLNAL